MIQTCGTAGLLNASNLERRLDGLVDVAKAAYLATLDEVEVVRAEEFLGRAQNVAQESWLDLVNEQKTMMNKWL